MLSVTRRTFGLAAVAAPALLTGTLRPALADGHARPAPALFDVSLGTYKMTTLYDGAVPLGKALFQAEDAAAMDAALAAGGLIGDALPAPVTAFLLQSDTQTILIDAGVGALDSFGPGLGRMSDGLAAAGVTPDGVDLVIVTHAHPDHIGGMIGANGPVFPNAEVVIMDVEKEFWGDAGIMAQAPAEAQGMFGLAQTVFDAYGDRVRTVQSGAEVAPGVTMELSPGHTPGHALVHIDAGEREMLMVADTLHSSVLHTALPDVAFGFDTDTAVAAASRRRVFDRAAADNLLIAATHIPFPGIGRFVRAGDAYAYVPATIA